jgi:hypothetical protein
MVVSLKNGLTRHLLGEQNDRDDDHGRSGETTDPLSGGGARLENGL